MASGKMKIPMQDLARSVSQEPSLLQIISDILHSGRMLNGPETNAFADEFSNFLGVKYFLGVGNGTDALEIALRAVGCMAGDEVLTVANAGGYTTAVCHLIGATPVYVDVEPDTLLMNLSLVPKAIICNKTKAIVITHLYGAMVDVQELRLRLASIGHGKLAIIEDCAQAHGAEMRNHKAGSLGDLAAFSFYPTKNLGACGDAGGIATQSPELFERARLLHQYGWKKRYCVATPYGRNSRIDELQAAILRHRLTRLEAHNERRRHIIRMYEQAGSSFLKFPEPRYQTPSGHLAVACTKYRDDLRRHLLMHNIDTDIHYPILDCDQESWRGLGRSVDQLTQSRRAASTIITIPNFPDMTDGEVQYVAEALAAYAERH
jgi:aminotransferase EvaB